MAMSMNGIAFMVTADAGSPLSPLSFTTDGRHFFRSPGSSTETLAELHIEPYIRRLNVKDQSVEDVQSIKEFGEKIHDFLPRPRYISPLNLSCDKKFGHIRDHPKDRIVNLDSGISVPDDRWSDIIPPETALTFAAIWDPDDGMITFTAADLFDMMKTPRPDKSVDSPSDIDERSSQVLTVDRVRLLSAPPTAMFAAEKSAQPLTFACETFQDESDITETFHVPPNVVLTRSSVGASSAATSALFDRIRSATSRPDDVMLCPREGTGHFLRPPTFNDAQVLNFTQRSAFSMSTESTSNYVHVHSAASVMSESEHYRTSWCEVDAPPYVDENTTHQPIIQRLASRLHKQKSQPCARASAVLARHEYNHETSSQETASRQNHHRFLNFGLASSMLGRFGTFPACRKADDRWVNVEITQIVTQRLV
ncbi:hypothetical protein BD410DRAFT_803770 [Rickenella mellea]|uniref:Uncharacterized protein n=1 Tax=Rickenella mellea TaxID=50990 RepID=A0A4Y7Q3R6_9AGAM|nr:hypothetical protein BD410DRAFT_803770 [Rickenella mellea]